MIEMSHCYTNNLAVLILLRKGTDYVIYSWVYGCHCFLGGYFVAYWFRNCLNKIEFVQNVFIFESDYQFSCL